ncbi:MAG: hypothetical protein HYR62_02895 [Actinobacteria bacterium]|nr:hypothetical protein [Actinomycetota bacterium]MBI3687417.1 hypothetical protein [Actinomycetota bacterium]
MTWWEDLPEARRNKLTALLDSDRARACRDRAGGDVGFAAWLLVAEATCRRQYMVSIFDLADWCWRDAYDDNMPPADALQEAIESDDLPWGLPDGE